MDRATIRRALTADVGLSEEEAELALADALDADAIDLRTPSSTASSAGS